MSAGAIALLFLFSGEVDGALGKLCIPSSLSAPSLGLPFLLLTFSSASYHYRLEGSKTDSMRLISSRAGFGVKYFGFLHIDGCFFFFLFLRGALT